MKNSFVVAHLTAEPLHGFDLHQTMRLVVVRTISSKVPRGSNRLKIASRNAAYSISSLKDNPLNKLYKKIASIKEE